MSTNAMLIVGLGNPGPTYAGNRHNVGAMVVDVLASRIGERFRSHKAGADVAEGRATISGPRLILAKPRSYMNVSGGPVAALLRFYTLPAESLIVVHDDLDIPYGAVRVKQGGGEGGHNGLRSISSAIGSRNYLRVRVGIGRPPGRMNPADFVLHDFSSVERADLAVGLEDAADAAVMLVTDGLTATQNQWHGAP
jgi:PTH1 family peptidyl-tRNA hydrolase